MSELSQIADDPLLEDKITVRYSAEQIAGFQRLRRELFQDVATLPAVVRYCALGGLSHELNRLKKERK